MIWHHQLSLEFFCKLRILSVHNCPCLVNLVPSHLIQSFQNLKEVNVYNCEALESVFDYRGFNGDGRILSKIEILTLKKLPKLRLIICNEDKNDNMSYLLSPSKFKDFYQLKELHIIDCGMLLDEEVSFLLYFFFFLMLLEIFREIYYKNNFEKKYEKSTLIFNNNFIKLI